MSFFDLPPIIERMLLVSDKISDLNFSVGQPPQVEINGKLTPVQPLGMQKLSREYFPAARRLLDRDARDSHRDPDAEISRPAAAVGRYWRAAQRPRARHRPDRLGQELNASGHHRRHQREKAVSHRHDRRSYR